MGVRPHYWGGGLQLWGNNLLLGLRVLVCKSKGEECVTRVRGDFGVAGEIGKRQLSGVARTWTARGGTVNRGKGRARSGRE